MATTPKPAASSAEDAARRVVVAAVKRRIQRAHASAYRRALRELVQDGECTEEQAKTWLAEIGVAEPEQPSKKK